MQFPDPKKIDAFKRLLLKYPEGAAISEIASRLKMNRNLIAKYLDHLTLTGQLEMKSIGSAKVFSLSHKVPVSSLINYASDMVILLDREQSILRLNDPILSVLSEKPEMLIGTKFRDCDDPFISSLARSVKIANPGESAGKVFEVSLDLMGILHHFTVKQIPVTFGEGYPGTAFILRDITENREDAEAIRQNNSDWAILHKKTCELSDLPSDADIWEVIAAGIKELYPGSVVCVNSFDLQTVSVTIRCFLGNDERNFLSTLIGRDPVGLVLGPTEEYYRRLFVNDLAGGRAVKIPGNLYIATFGKIPKNIAEKFEKVFNIGDLYTIGLNVRGVLLGNLVIFLRNGTSLDRIDLLEIYARQAALALKCRALEQDISVPPVVAM